MYINQQQIGMNTSINPNTGVRNINQSNINTTLNPHLNMNMSNMN